MGHLHELYDFTVSAFIVHDSKILLLHHKKLNTWLQPGGHVELDEDPEMTLWREIKEETGLDKVNLQIIELATDRPSSTTNKNLPLPFDFNVHSFPPLPGHQHIDISYLIRSSTDSIKQNLIETNDLRWFSEDEIEQIKTKLLPDIYSRATFALNVAF